MANLEDVIKTAIETALRETHTATPAKIISFDPATQTASVQPTIKRVFKDGDVLPLPVITGIRVAFQKVGDFTITFPLKAGDEGLLIFGERSMDNWRKTGDISEPNDTRMHDLSDAVFFPMCYSDPKVIPSFSATDIAIRTADNTGRIEIAPDGKIEITRGGDKVLQTISDTLGTLGITTVTVTVGSSAGTYPIDQQATFNSLKAVIDAIKK